VSLDCGVRIPSSLLPRKLDIDLKLQSRERKRQRKRKERKKNSRGGKVDQIHKKYIIYSDAVANKR